MAETIQTLTARLDHVEKVLGEVRYQLSWLVDESTPASPKHKETMEGREVYPLRDKQREAQAIEKMRAHLGIADIKLIPIEALHEQMKRHGICPENNEFSRAIIAEREK